MFFANSVCTKGSFHKHFSLWLIFSNICNYFFYIANSQTVNLPQERYLMYSVKLHLFTSCFIEIFLRLKQIE